MIGKYKTIIDDLTEGFRKTNCYSCNNYNKDKMHEVSSAKCAKCKKLREYFKNIVGGKI